MNEPTFNYHDEAFGLDIASDCTLLVQLHANEFAYAIASNSRLLVCESGHPLEELSSPEELADIFEADYKQVIAGLPATGFSLVPVDLYTENNAAGFASLLNVQPAESVFTQRLDSENYIIYKVNTKLAELAKTRFGLQNTVFNAKGWIKAVAASNPADDTLYVQLQDNRIELLYYRYGKIRYYNSFECYGVDEVIYFSALAAKAINMEPAAIRLCLSGAIENGDELLNKAAEFFKAADISNINLLQLPVEIQPQQVLSLAALSLCAS